nr:magnesium transporter [Johnsonella ignava]
MYLENNKDVLESGFLELLENKNLRKLREKLIELNEADIAEFIDTLDSEKSLIAFRLLPKGLATDVFACLDNDKQEHIVKSMTDSELSFIIEDLYVDDAVDMLEELPSDLVNKVLANATPNTRKLINEMLKYPDNSAGSIMTVEYIGLKKSMTVGEAFDYVRKNSFDKENVYTGYVMDEKRILEGVVTVKELLMNSTDAMLDDIMSTNIIKAVTTDNRETIVELFNKYDLLSLPVVDLENRLVGIVTVDDAVSIMEEEVTEDFEKMAAMTPSEKPYLKTNVFVLAKNRITWLLVLMFSSMITGGILSRYEAQIAVLPLLVTFIPMLTDTGGNAGSQSSTMIIRGMAIGEIDLGDALKIIWKEFRVSIVVGSILAVVNFIKVLMQYPGKYNVGITVGLSMFCTVMMANIVGGLLPMLAKKLNIDPTIMASPLISTLVDAMSLMIFFGLAVEILHI